MREIKQSAAFKRDVKRESNGPNLAVLNAVLPVVLNALANSTPIPSQFYDHALQGQWKGFRECHIRPDLLLVYKEPSNDKVKLARLGSHSELFSK
jgi:mRNA interferase YafQ